MSNRGGISSPYKYPCTSTLSDGGPTDTMRWEDDNIPRCVCVFAIHHYIPELCGILTFISCVVCVFAVL